jgi:hypothetical protein
LSRFDPTPLDDQQARYLKGAVAAWRRYLGAQDDRALVDGALAWKKVKGREYLVHSWYDSLTGTKRSRSLGPRSLKTEGEKLEFDHRRREADEALAAAEAPLGRQTRVAKALRLGRLNNTGAEILRELRKEQVLGPSFYVVDSSVVAGYEAQAGVFMPKGLEAAPNRLELCTATDVDEALLDDLVTTCRRVDPSFRRSKDTASVQSDRFEIMLYSRQHNFDWLRRSGRFDREQLDLLRGAFRAQPIRTVAIAKNGMPVEIVGPDPRNFALIHYASDVAGMEEGKDRAYAVGRLVQKHWPERFSLSVFEAFPEFAGQVAPGALRAKAPQVEDPEVEDPDAGGPGSMRYYGP